MRGYKFFAPISLKRFMGCSTTIDKKIFNDIYQKEIIIYDKFYTSAKSSLKALKARIGNTSRLNDFVICYSDNSFPV